MNDRIKTIATAGIVAFIAGLVNLELFPMAGYAVHFSVILSSGLIAYIMRDSKGAWEGLCATWRMLKREVSYNVAWYFVILAVTIPVNIAFITHESFINESLLSIGVPKYLLIATLNSTESVVLFTVLVVHSLILLISMIFALLGIALLGEFSPRTASVVACGLMFTANPLGSLLVAWCVCVLVPPILLCLVVIRIRWIIRSISVAISYFFTYIHTEQRLISALGAVGGAGWGYYVDSLWIHALAGGVIAFLISLISGLALKLPCLQLKNTPS